MGTMNGNPFWSPPSRHTRCLGARFLGLEETLPGEPPSLDEFPRLIEQAIKAGLVKRPDPVKEETTLSGKPIAEWRHITCIKCGQHFVRGHRKHTACTGCRVPKKNCTVCAKSFQPPNNKIQCCSEECVMQSKSAGYRPRVIPMHTCKVCQQPFTGRLSGAGWAKTCGVECTNTAKRNYHLEKRELRMAAKKAKK